MNYNPNIGLHLRIDKTFSSIIKQVNFYNLKTFQFFLTDKTNQKYIKIKDKEIEEFKDITKDTKNIYIHSSYWINLACGNIKKTQISENLLKYEIKTAKTLGIKNIILHAGSAKEYKNCTNNLEHKISGIKTLASILNKIADYQEDVKLLLENTAHANKTIGSDLNDFVLLQNMLLNPQKTGFCLDSAHAFAYGYDLHKIERFINTLENTIKTSNIDLIHFNDSAEKQGSKLDKHAIPGKGYIGKKNLRNLINHPKLLHIPILSELPEIPATKTLDAIKIINELKTTPFSVCKNDEMNYNL